MAAAISATTGGAGDVAETVTITGAAATTTYTVLVTEADGSIATPKVTTDGSGNATLTWNPQMPGVTSYTLQTTTVTTVAGPATSQSGSE